MPQPLGDMLVEAGLLSAEDLDKATRLSRENHESLVATLLSQRWVREEALLQVLARQQGLAFTRLQDLVVTDETVKSLSAKFVSHYGIMPVKLQDGVLTLALSTPFDMAAVEDVETNLGYRVERVLACRADIALAIQRYYGVGAETVERILADQPERLAEARVDEAQDLERLADDASVVKLVNQILHQAIQERATDIHFEVYRDGIQTRRRIDGILHDTSVSHHMTLLYPAIVSRIKLMAGLNIVERRLPQDGRARVNIGAAQYDLRVSVVPTLHGENVVIRILPTTMLFSLDQLGLSPHHLDLLAGLIRQPHGIVFLTGPTGSGKSTTLYACLTRLNTRDHKIITIEDPVEYEIKGIMQTQINPKIGLSFARALRSMLRHDPDIMMVGEVRDRETADVTIQTALTGHLVFSTLHTNDAASAAIRLLDMGIDPYLITSTVRAFIAQRLVRVICPQCKEPVAGPPPRFRGRGCRHCSGTGYFGRMAICEFLLLRPALQDLVLRHASAREIRDVAVAQGMTTLAADGWARVEQGLTTADEVLRVTAEAAVRDPAAP